MIKEELQQEIISGKMLENDNFIEKFAKLDIKTRQSFLAILFSEAERDVVPGGFRSYDIRIDSSKLPSHVVFYIALKAALNLKEFTSSENMNFLTAVGQAAETARPSSTRIKKVYINAFRLSGLDVIDLGVTTTPDVYFSASYFLADNIKAVVNVSASHNPAKDNGLKHCIRDEEGFIYSISQSQMAAIAEACLDTETRKTSNKVIAGHLLSLNQFGALIKKFASEHELCEIHQEYLEFCAILGREVMTALKLRFKGDLRKVLATVRDLFKEAKSWLEITSALDLANDIKEPVFFNRKCFSNYHVVLDYAKGTGFRAASLYRSLGATVEELTEERGFNPLEEKNQQNLKTALKESLEKNEGKEIIGFAHDEDADRLAVMRSDGVSVPGDRLLFMLAKGLTPFLKDHAGKRALVVTEVKSRPETRKALLNLGVKVLVVPTGFAFIKGAAIEIEKCYKDFLQGKNDGKMTIYDQEVDLSEDTPVIAWAELSGHFGFYHDFYNFFDDASMMALFVMEIIEQYKRDEEKEYGSLLINMDESFPSYPSSGELNLFLKTDDPEYVPTSGEKQKVVDFLAENFLSTPQVDRIDYIDGIQITFKDQTKYSGGWILIRKSNNEDKLVLVTSAPDQETLDEVEALLFSLAAETKVSPISGLVLREEDNQGEERISDPYIAKRIKELFRSE